MAPNSTLCRTILISIANPRVFHSALHTGSDTGREYGLHTFPRTILRQLESSITAKRLTSWALPTAGGMAIPKNFSIRFGAHKDAIYNTPVVSRVGPLTPAATAPTRAAHAAYLTSHHPLLR